MAGMLRKAGEYLGLVDVGDYDDGYDGAYGDGYGHQPQAPVGYGAPAGYEQQPAYSAQPLGTGGHVEPAYPRGQRPPPQQQQQGYPAPPVAVPSQAAEVRITTVSPRAYNDAKHIGEQFRNGVPVIMNLEGMEDADARRLVDFAAGLTFGLHGDLQRVTRGVFLLRPEGVQVALDDGSGVVEGGFYNQS
jgi:cell division inhibitor SepF